MLNANATPGWALFPAAIAHQGRHNFVGRVIVGKVVDVLVVVCPTAECHNAVLKNATIGNDSRWICLDIEWEEAQIQHARELVKGGIKHPEGREGRNE